MRNPLRSTLIVPQTCLLFVLTVSVATSTQAQTRTTADKPDEQSRALSFLPRYKLSLSSQSSHMAPAKRKSGGSPSGSLTPMALNLQVLGGGTLGRLTKWTGFTSSNSFIGDSTIFEDKNGNVGIGTDMPTSKLTVNGTIQASGGVSVVHNTTLTGNGTSGSPLGVAVPLRLMGAAPDGTFGVITATNTAEGGAGITGFAAFSNSTADGGAGVLGFGGGSNGFAGTGVGGVGGNSDTGIGGLGVFAQGGTSKSNSAGNGVTARGGPSNSGSGGAGVSASGGFSGSGGGGIGVLASGGSSSNQRGGFGVLATGGHSLVSGSGGTAMRAFGGDGIGAGNIGGIGIEATGGEGADGATKGLAGKFNGDVQVTGNTSVTSAGKGIVLKSPDGVTCRLVSIDNAGNLVLTAISCP